ncbi:MAG: hypothetical protein D6776_12320 [Planctomycetota bacterium]|nr:MAG: hypothetical protein D6776_12320 [Planctomycetota bacterium]
MSSPGLVRLNADGSIDAAFDVGSGMPGGGASAIAVADDGSGDVYVGGGFTLYNGAPVLRIVRLNADGSVDTSFAPPNGGFDKSVSVIVGVGDGSGRVYVGGSFTSYNGVTVMGLVRLRSDGSIDSAFDVGSGFDKAVKAIAVAGDGSGDIYVAGDFTTCNGTSVNRIVRLDADGSIDTGFSVGGGFDDFVFAIAPATDGSGDVYVGGRFGSYDGASAKGIARLNADGSLDTGFAAVGFDDDDQVDAILPVGDGSGDVYVAGRFAAYGTSTVDHVVRLNPDGSRD